MFFASLHFLYFLANSCVSSSFLSCRYGRSLEDYSAYLCKTDRWKQNEFTSGGGTRRGSSIYFAIPVLYPPPPPPPPHRKTIYKIYSFALGFGSPSSVCKSFRSSGEKLDEFMLFPWKMGEGVSASVAEAWNRRTRRLTYLLSSLLKAFFFSSKFYPK